MSASASSSYSTIGDFSALTSSVQVGGGSLLSHSFNISRKQSFTTWWFSLLMTSSILDDIRRASPMLYHSTLAFQAACRMLARSPVPRESKVEKKGYNL